MSANVSYDREGERGLDVALWTHEDLLPYEDRDMSPRLPAATKKFTGPKYLELAFRENEESYINWLKDAFSYGSISKDIKAATVNVTKGGLEKYMVSITRLNEARLEQQLKSKLKK